MGGRNLPEGPLKITTTVAFGSTWLTRVVKQFIDDYPGIEVSLLLTDTDLENVYSRIRRAKQRFGEWLRQENSDA